MNRAESPPRLGETAGSSDVADASQLSISSVASPEYGLIACAGAGRADAEAARRLSEKRPDRGPGSA